MNKIIPISMIGILLLGGVGVVAITTMNALTDNHAPDAPDIVGPTDLKIGVHYLFLFITTDPEGDNISYYVDWGDGTNSGWLGPYGSGQDVKMVHTWVEKGNDSIKAKARDNPYGAESNWTYHPISWSYSISPQINSQNTQKIQSQKCQQINQLLYDLITGHRITVK